MPKKITYVSLLILFLVQVFFSFPKAVFSATATAKVEIINNSTIIGLRGEGLGRYFLWIQYTGPTGAQNNLLQITFEVSKDQLDCKIEPYKNQIDVTSLKCNREPSQSSEAWIAQLEIGKKFEQGTSLILHDDDPNTATLVTQALDKGGSGNSSGFLSVTVSPTGELLNDQPHDITITWQPAIDTANNIPRSYTISSQLFELPVKTCDTVVCSITTTLPAGVAAGDILVTVRQADNLAISGTSTFRIDSAAIKNFCDSSQITSAAYNPDQETLSLELSGNSRVNLVNINLTTAKVANCDIGQVISEDIQQTPSLGAGPFQAKINLKVNSAANQCIKGLTNNQPAQQIDSDLQARLSVRDSDGGSVAQRAITCQNSVFSNKVALTPGTPAQPQQPPQGAAPPKIGDSRTVWRPCDYDFKIGALTQLLGVRSTQQEPGIRTAIGCIPTRLDHLILAGLYLFLGVGGGIAFLLMLFASFQMVTSAGNPQILQEAHEQFTNAIIGLLFVILSVLLLQVIGAGILRLPGFFIP